MVNAQGRERPPLVTAMSRVGAVVALLYFLVRGLGPSVEYGRAIGESFIHALAVGPFATPFFEKLLTAIGILLMGLAIMQLFVLFGALFGTLVGVVLAPYLGNGMGARRDGTEV